MSYHASKFFQPFKLGDGKGLLDYILRIFKAFIFIALGFGLPIGIFITIRINSFYGFIEGIIAGILVALAGMAILIPLDIFQRIRCYLKYGTIDFGVTQERRLRIEGDYISVFKALYNVLEKRKKLETLYKDAENGVIQAVTKRSLRSLGEKINIELLKTSSKGKVLVILSSKPKMFASTTMFDYSKNFENLESFLKDLKEHFKEGEINKI